MKVNLHAVPDKHNKEEIKLISVLAGDVLAELESNPEADIDQALRDAIDNRIPSIVLARQMHSIDEMLTKEGKKIFDVDYKLNVIGAFIFTEVKKLISVYLQSKTPNLVN